MEITLIQPGVVSLIPPVFSIILALITKEVYSSLFIGVFSGTLIYAFASGGSLISAILKTLDMLSAKIAENAYLLVFLALMGAVLSIILKSGGSEAFGQWAEKRLRTKRSALLATSLLGILIFIDDGFNSLTVGSIMRPITGKLNISREKLAYIIDATAAPVCVISPVSSWAVAVASELSDAGGFNTFLSTIPYNFYSILALLLVFLISFTGKDFGPMKKAEDAAAVQSLELHTDVSTGSGRIFDLALPMFVVVVCSILGMAYVGDFFNGVSFSEAIGYNPVAGLSLGAFAGLAMTFALYIPRKLMTAKDFFENIVSGISSIVSPVLILILSWSLDGVCRQMIGTGEFVSSFFHQISFPFALLPVIIFIVSTLMSFSMGASWGTFGMLIPIVTMICSTESSNSYLIPALGATLAGSVCGDHCSPLSDTTVLSSIGAGCLHIRHVETQLPYAILVAVICVVGYLIVGFTKTPWVSLPVCSVLLVVLEFVLSKFNCQGTGCTNTSVSPHHL